MRVDPDQIVGFLATDVRGRLVGRVERSLHRAPGAPDTLYVRSVFRRWRRCRVSAAAIVAVDDRTRVVGLRIDRDEIEVLG